jgi:hypothetical protein
VDGGLNVDFLIFFGFFSLNGKKITSFEFKRVADVMVIGRYMCIVDQLKCATSILTFLVNGER